MRLSPSLSELGSGNKHSFLTIHDAAGVLSTSVASTFRPLNIKMVSLFGCPLCGSAEQKFTKISVSASEFTIASMRISAETSAISKTYPSNSNQEGFEENTKHTLNRIGAV